MDVEIVGDVRGKEVLEVVNPIIVRDDELEELVRPIELGLLEDDVGVVEDDVVAGPMPLEDGVAGKVVGLPPVETGGLGGLYATSFALSKPRLFGL